MTVKLAVIFGKYGRERDEYVSRAKIMLNVHFYDAKIFESVRVSYLLNNNCFVLSEESNDYHYEKVNLVFGSQDELPEKCRLYIDNILARGLRGTCGRRSEYQKTSMREAEIRDQSTGNRSPSSRRSLSSHACTELVEV